MKYIVIVLASLLTIFSVSAQTPVYEVAFMYRFDNREYPREMDESSGTIFGARLGLRGGLAFGEGHTLMAGVGIPYDFGQRAFYNLPSISAYYQYISLSDNTRIFVGTFPSVKRRGYYSSAFFSDEVRFNDSNLEGILYQTRGEWGDVEAGADWNGMYSDDRRESFRIFSAGEFNLLKNLSIGYNGTMFHYAGSTTIGGVVDNHLFMPYVKLQFTDKKDVMGIALRAGYFIGYQWDRVQQDSPTIPMGFEGEVALWWKRWSFSTSIYVGEDLMPLYNTLDVTGNPYSTSLYCGEQFYRATNGIYSRINIGYRVFKNGWLEATTQSVFHLDGKNFGWQQVVAVSVLLN